MEIRLTEHLAKFVNNKVEEGGYEDASEVVREALRNFEAGGRPVKGAMDRDIENGTLVASYAQEALLRFAS